MLINILKKHEALKRNAIEEFVNAIIKKGHIDATSLLIILVLLMFMAAWITHIVTAIATKAWLFLMVGILVSPIGIVHGIATWLGYVWL